MRLIVLAVTLTACGGTTGSHLSTWSATASGPADANGTTLEFTNEKGADVELTRAFLYVGAVYFNEVHQNSAVSSQQCIASGNYAGEVFGGLEVDMLSPAPQPFPTPGEGTENPALTAQVWLTGGDVNASDDTTIILDVAGTATQDAIAYPFTGRVTIGENRAVSPTNPAEPGASPICLQRIVTPISVELTFKQGGTLAMQIDPRGILAEVDFSKLTPAADDPTQFVIPDTNVGPGAAVFRGLQRVNDVYTFSFGDPQ
jgi:hypothetical protein